jgi:glycosyltransferase involved in cell wall biosynthesis
VRIGIDYTSAAHQRAGIGRYTRGIVEALAALGGEHSYVLVVAGGGGPGEGVTARQAASVTTGNFRIRQLPLSHRLWTVLWHRLRVPLPVDLFAGPVDVFHAPDYVLPPLRQGKKVVTIHDLSFLRYPEAAEPSLAAYLCRSVPRSVREADLVLADSENTRQDIIELLGVPPDRVEVVYPGVGRTFRVIEDRHALEPVARAYGIRFPFILSV